MHGKQRLASPSSYAAFILHLEKCCLNTGAPTNKSSLNSDHTFDDFNSYNYLFIFYNSIFFLYMPKKQNWFIFRKNNYFFIYFFIFSNIFFFFFFYDIDERRRYTKKVHPLKTLVGPSIVERRIRGDLLAG